MYEKEMEEINTKLMEAVEGLIKSTPPNFAYNEVMNTILKGANKELSSLTTKARKEAYQKGTDDTTEYWLNDSNKADVNKEVVKSFLRGVLTYKPEYIVIVKQLRKLLNKAKPENLFLKETNK